MSLVNPDSRVKRAKVFKIYRYVRAIHEEFLSFHIKHDLLHVSLAKSLGCLHGIIFFLFQLL